MINVTILTILVLAGLWTAMTRSLLRSAIGLALTSAMLTMFMFRLNSPLAAVFELSVCTGLISVLFVSTISLTHALSWDEIMRHMKERFKRFWYLPIILAVVASALALIKVKTNLILPPPEIERDPRVVLWDLRQLDVIGQVIILLAGVFGVVILFKDKREK